MEINNTPDLNSEMNKESLISKDETKPKNPAQILKKINGSKEKDLSNEVLYFSINQDSKLVKIIYIFII
jgi:hypothetical protein